MPYQRHAVLRPQPGSFYGVLGILPCVVILSGCAGGEAEQPAFRITERDSAGVRIVELSDPAHAALPRWSVAGPDAAHFVIGTGEDASHELFRVVAATMLSEGDVAIANAGSHEIRVFDATGEFRRSMGRRGAGPGEFQALSWIGEWAPDTVLAYDARLQRMTWFSSAGEVVRTQQLDVAETGVSDLEAVSHGNGRFVARTSFGRIFGAGERRDRVTLYVFDAAGQVADSLGTYEGPETFFHATSEFSMRLDPILGRTAHTHGERGRVAAGSNDAFAFDVFDDGRMTARVRADVQDQRANAAWVAAQRRAIAERAVPPGVDMAAIAALVPERATAPAFDEIRVDRLGFVWVRDFAMDNAPRQWTVFGETLQPTARLRVDPDLRILEIGADYILALRRDEDGVEQVLGLHLRRSD